MYHDGMRRSIRFLILAGVLALAAQTVRPGLYAASEVRALPLRTSGYQVYMVGEAHGVANNAEFQMAYLRPLYAAEFVTSPSKKMRSTERTPRALSRAERRRPRHICVCAAHASPSAVSKLTLAGNESEAKKAAEGVQSAE